MKNTPEHDPNVLADAKTANITPAESRQAVEDLGLADAAPLAVAMRTSYHTFTRISPQLDVDELKYTHPWCSVGDLWAWEEVNLHVNPEVMEILESAVPDLDLGVLSSVWRTGDTYLVLWQHIDDIWPRNTFEALGLAEFIPGENYQASNGAIITIASAGRRDDNGNLIFDAWMAPAGERLYLTVWPGADFATVTDHLLVPYNITVALPRATDDDDNPDGPRGPIHIPDGDEDPTDWLTGHQIDDGGHQNEWEAQEAIEEEVA